MFAPPRGPQAPPGTPRPLQAECSALRPAWPREGCVRPAKPAIPQSPQTCQVWRVARVVRRVRQLSGRLHCVCTPAGPDDHSCAPLAGRGPIWRPLWAHCRSARSAVRAVRCALVRTRQGARGGPDPRARNETQTVPLALQSEAPRASPPRVPQPCPWHGAGGALITEAWRQGWAGQAGQAGPPRHIHPLNPSASLGESGRKPVGPDCSLKTNEK